MNIIKIYLIMSCIYYYEEILLELIYNFYNLTTLKNNDNILIENLNKLLMVLIICEYVKNIGIKSIINLAFIFRQLAEAFNIIYVATIDCPNRYLVFSCPAYFFEKEQKNRGG